MFALFINAAILILSAAAFHGKQEVAELEKAGLGDDYRRACYFDAFHMKLWNPSAPDVVALHPTDRPESTRKVQGNRIKMPAVLWRL